MARSDIRKMFDERFRDKPINADAMKDEFMILQMIVEDMKICRPSYGDLKIKYGISVMQARRLRYKAARVLGLN